MGANAIKLEHKSQYANWPETQAAYRVDDFYTVTVMNKMLNLANDLGKIRNRLKCERGILNRHDIMLKGMHWYIYQRQTIKHDAHVSMRN